MLHHLLIISGELSLPVFLSTLMASLTDFVLFEFQPITS
jgi:hypothetical protein